MNYSIEQMLAAYPAKTIAERKNALKEVVQEVVLCGLSRAGFFDTAAFYGGTALRIFYGLDRFSEDLDFSLIASDSTFDLTDYFPALEAEARSFGLNVEIQKKAKAGESDIQSAFLKGNTQEHLLMPYPNDEVSGIARDERIKIKFEVDTNPPAHATFERRYRLLPSPYEVRLYDEASLFAGKIHAVLCRGWKNRVKGRDLYDYVFYLSRNASVNMEHLAARLAQTGNLDTESPFHLDELKAMLNERFDSIDFEAAKDDVLPFVLDSAALSVWSTEFFKKITGELLNRTEQ